MPGVCPSPGCAWPEPRAQVAFLRIVASDLSRLANWAGADALPGAETVADASRSTALAVLSKTASIACVVTFIVS